MPRSRSHARWLGIASATLLALGVSGGVPSATAARSAGRGPVFVIASPTGTGGTCSVDQPCSLPHAQRNARHLASTMDADINVVLEGGTYHLARPIRLGPSDSGRHGHMVSYGAAPGEHPVISAGRRISDWHRVAHHHGIWSAKVPSGFDTRQLYVDGHRLRQARGLPKGTGFVQTKTGFTATTTTMAAWPHPSNIQAVFRGGNGPWTQTACPIASIHGATITMAQPCWRNLHLKALGVQELAWVDDPMGGFGGLGSWKTPTRFENTYPLLRPRHWTIDHVSHRIYYEPKRGERPSRQRIVVPTRQTLLRVAGTAAHPVHDVTISGLTFAYGGWTAPDTRNGFPQMQADWYLRGHGANHSEGTCQYSTPQGSCPFASWTRTPANVVLFGTRRVIVIGDTFRHLGGAGLDVYGGSMHDVIKGNEFDDISASGIQLGSTDDPLPVHGKALDRHNIVTENYVHNVAIQYLGGIGIWLGYTAHSRITHNQVDDVPYTGISVGWGGWHAFLLTPDSDDNLNAHNVVAHNLIYNYMIKLGDGGAVYTNGSQALRWPAALHIAHNVAYNGLNTDFSLYTDAASQYVVIDHNFVYDQPFDSFNTGGCRTIGHIRIHDNYFSQGGPAYPCFAYVDVVSTNDTSVCVNPRPSETPTPIVRHAGITSEFRDLITRSRPSINLIGPTQLPTTGGRVLIGGSGFTRNSIVHFGHRVAPAVRVLSGNYLVATAPAGSGFTAVAVTTRAGTSHHTEAAAVTYTPTPLPCVPGVGGGLTTKLFTG